MRAIAETDHLTTVLVAAPLDRRKRERARRKCLGALLPALEELGDTHITWPSQPMLPGRSLAVVPERTTDPRRQHPRTFAEAGAKGRPGTVGQQPYFQGPVGDDRTVVTFHQRALDFRLGIL